MIKNQNALLMDFIYFISLFNLFNLISTETNFFHKLAINTYLLTLFK